MRRGEGVRWLALIASLSSCSLMSPDDATLTGAPPVTPGPTSSACAPGTKACAKGCAPVDAPATGCAAESCAPCSFAHAQALCIDGACAPGPCENGHADCDRDPANGCEADLQRDPGRCGGCLQACTSLSPACEGGVCVPRCGAVKLLDGSAQAVTKQGVAAAGDFTLELWLRWHGEFVASASSAVLTTNQLLPANGLILACALDPVLGCAFNLVAGASLAEAEHLYVPLGTASVWHHLAFQRTGGELRAFLDGVPGEVTASSAKLVATSGIALGRNGQVPPRDAAPVSVGPVRFSTIARYAGPFTPVRYLASDEHTAFSWLSSGAFDGATLSDTSGHQLHATVTSPGHLLLDPSSPCAP